MSCVAEVTASARRPRFAGRSARAATFKRVFDINADATAKRLHDRLREVSVELTRSR
jgi:hypothetical protein